MEIYNLILSSDEGILIENDSIENFLTKKLVNGSNLSFNCIPECNSLERSKEEMDELESSIIYVVNTNENMNSIAYWQLGYAMGKGVQVIGYCAENCSIQIESDVEEIIAIPKDINRFLKKINRFVSNLKPEVVAIESWDTQSKPAMNEQRAQED